MEKLAALYIKKIQKESTYVYNDKRSLRKAQINLILWTNYIKQIQKETNLFSPIEYQLISYILHSRLQTINILLSKIKN